MKAIFLAALALTFAQSPSLAHEGHDKTPGAVAAPHGGIVQGTNQLYLELVPSADGVKIYPMDHDVKPVALSEVKLDGTATFPKKSKGEPVKFSQEGDAFVAKIAAKGAHRYTLNLNVEYKGKKEKAKFTVEPQ